MYNARVIIGITGTNSAGKGTVVDYLVKEKGFKHYSARDFIYEEVDRLGLPHNRNSTNLAGNALRQAHGPAYIFEQLLARAQTAGGDAIVESMRTIGEAEYFKSRGAFIWAVDADRKLRYNRAVLRGSSTDQVSFEEFCAQEDREMSQTAPHDMNIFGVMQRANHIFTNNSTPEELYAQVEAVLQQIQK